MRRQKRVTEQEQPNRKPVSYTLRKLLQGLLLILGVTFISFVLMVWYGPDQTYNLIGKNASAEQIAEVRTQLGYDQPFARRYFDYLASLFTLDLGSSSSSGEPWCRPTCSIRQLCWPATGTHSC